MASFTFTAAVLYAADDHSSDNDAAYRFSLHISCAVCPCSRPRGTTHCHSQVEAALRVHAAA